MQGTIDPQGYLRLVAGSPDVQLSSSPARPALAPVPAPSTPLPASSLFGMAPHPSSRRGRSLAPAPATFDGQVQVFVVVANLSIPSSTAGLSPARRRRLQQEQADALHEHRRSLMRHGSWGTHSRQQLSRQLQHGRALQQADEQDQLLFQVTLVPIRAGSQRLARMPTDLTLLFVDGVAPAGNVLILDRGRSVTTVSAANGRGSSRAAVARNETHSWAADYQGSPKFPATGGISATFVGDDTNTAQSSPPPLPESTPAPSPIASAPAPQV